MKKNSKYQAPVSPKAIAASQKLVEKAARAFDSVESMSPSDRQKTAKMKRGAQEVIETIERISQKFAVEAPGVSFADTTSALDHAKALGPLVAAVGAFHKLLKDEYLRSQGFAWKNASASYAMLRAAAKADASIANELQPVQKWFRQRARSTNASAPAAKPAPTATSPQA